MLGILKFEFKRMHGSTSMLAAAFASFLLVLVDVKHHYDLYKDGIDVGLSSFTKWVGVNCSSFGGLYLFMAFPILAALGYSFTVTTDRSTGYIYQLITRVGRKKYFLAKFIVVFISGGIIFASAMLLDYMLISMFQPAVYPITWDLNSFMDPFSYASDLYYNNIGLFFIVCILTSFVWGGCIAGLAAAAGLFLRNKIVTALFPFIVFTAESIIGDYLMARQIFMMKGTTLELRWKNMFSTSIGTRCPADWLWLNITFLVVIPLIVYILRGRKYECI